MYTYIVLVLVGRGRVAGCPAARPSWRAEFIRINSACATSLRRDHNILILAKNHYYRVGHNSFREHNILWVLAAGSPNNRRVRRVIENADAQNDEAAF
jgi:hypothetical protein